jgi:chromosomal replication initiation ATPase DnaA
MGHGAKQVTTLIQVAEAAADVMNVTHASLCGPEHGTTFSTRRHIAMYLVWDVCREIPIPIGYQQLAELYKRRNHTTAWIAVNIKIKPRIKSSHEFSRQLDRYRLAIMEQLNASTHPEL